MNIKLFRSLVQSFLEKVNQNQIELAKALKMNDTNLSQKLHGTGKYAAGFSLNELKNLLLVLTEWEAINSQAEALSLLEALGYTYTSLSPAQWKTPPLHKLTPLPRGSDSHAFQASLKQPHHNLPSYLNLLIGREPILDELVTLYGTKVLPTASQEPEPRPRLLNLTGPGGVGKTRLAVALAWRLLGQFQDGVYLVRLETLDKAGEDKAAKVVSTIARTVSVTLPKRLKEEVEVLGLLKNQLRHRKVLLVLDNFEHVSEAAPVLTELLEAAPLVQIVVTSRSALQLQGEYVFEVPGLGWPNLRQEMPSPAQLLADPLYGAVALFARRGKAARSSFGLTPQVAPIVAEICARLDGLPLALELAAARLRIFSPQLLLSKLTNRLELLTGGGPDRPARQQTLRATIEWSYELLDKAEQTLFKQIGVFVGVFTMKAAHLVSYPEGMFSEIQTAALLAKLVDQNMLTVVEQASEQNDCEPRFRMLETLREYALDRLAQNPIEIHEVKFNHLLYHVALAEGLQPLLKGPEQGKALDLLELELGNIRQGLDWIQEPANPIPNIQALGWVLVVKLTLLWEVRGYVSEGRRYTRLLLTQANSEVIPITRDAASFRGSALNLAGSLALTQGDYQEAITFFEEALLTAGQHDLGLLADDAQLNLRMVQAKLAATADKTSQLDLAFDRELTAQIKRFRSEGNHAGLFKILLNEGIAARKLQHYIQARQCYKEAWTLIGEKAAPKDKAKLLLATGALELEEGHYKTAGQNLEESLRLCREINDLEGYSHALQNLAQLSLLQGYRGPARTLYEESLKLEQQLGNRAGVAQVLHALGLLAQEAEIVDQVGQVGRRLLAESAELYGQIGDWAKYNEVLSDLFPI